jgi:hypothetical protein
MDTKWMSFRERPCGSSLLWRNAQHANEVPKTTPCDLLAWSPHDPSPLDGGKEGGFWKMDTPVAIAACEARSPSSRALRVCSIAIHSSCSVVFGILAHTGACRGAKIALIVGVPQYEHAPNLPNRSMMRISIVFLDAYRDNLFIRRLAVGRNLSSRGLARVETSARGMLVAFAAAPGLGGSRRREEEQPVYGGIAEKY